MDTDVLFELGEQGRTGSCVYCAAPISMKGVRAMKERIFTLIIWLAMGLVLCIIGHLQEFIQTMLRQL